MELLAIDWHPIAVAAAMELLDVITGFSGAAKSKKICSGAMRQGLWHKAGFFLMIAFAAVWEIGTVWLNVEVSGIGVVMPDIPAVGAVCTFIVATEAVSILANLCELNPDIAQLPVIKNLAPHTSEKPDMTVEIEEEPKTAQ